MMATWPPQTEHNKEGHKIARGLGFLPTWTYTARHSKVACIQCGHELPWYHHAFQRRHRLKCALKDAKENE